MNEPIKPAEEPKPAQTDIFGSSNVPPAPPVVEPDKKPIDPTDIEQNPLVIELRTQLKNTKDSLGGNLSALGKKTKLLEKQLAEALKNGGLKPDGKNGKQSDVPFKEIKRSKDLTQDQRDEMTDNEIKQMDIIADLQEKQNEAFLKQNATQEEGDEDGGDDDEGGEEKVTEVDKTVKAMAKELAGGDIDLANLIIESAKQFNLTGLTKEQLKERVISAHKLVPNYVPPKEQGGIQGGTVKAGANKNDPHGVDKIIEEATTSGKGGYTL